MTDHALITAELDEANLALAEVTVALASLYPSLNIASWSAPTLLGFAEDAQRAASRARTQVNAAIVLLRDAEA